MNSLHKKIYQLQTADVSARKTKNIILELIIYLVARFLNNKWLPWDYSMRGFNVIVIR